MVTLSKALIGSAYGEGGIWGRWCVYASVGHGNNKELRDLLAEKGESHATNFRFSILEVLDILATDKEVLEREVHWKNALMSKEFGYNSN